MTVGVAVVAIFGPWIWALIDIESDKQDERQETENFIAEMRNRSSLESVDTTSNLLVARVAAVVTEQTPVVAFPNGPSSGLDNCLRYLTNGKRINGRSQVGTRKVPDDAWDRVRDRIVAEARAFDIARIEVDDRTPQAQVLRLSDGNDDIELTISNANQQARTIISVSTGCHLPASELSTTIRPTS